MWVYIASMDRWMAGRTDGRMDVVMMYAGMQAKVKQMAGHATYYDIHASKCTGTYTATERERERERAREREGGNRQRTDN